MVAPLLNRVPVLFSFRLMEEAYVMKDPFGDRAGNQQPVILGSHCVACSRAVCVGQVIMNPPPWPLGYELRTFVCLSLFVFLFLNPYYAAPLT